MTDALTFLQSITGFARAEASQESANRPPRFATVDPAFVWEEAQPLPKVTFDGETTMSGRRYPYLNGYFPIGGDRVLMLPVGYRNYVIVGSVETAGGQGWAANPADDLYSAVFGANGEARLDVEAGVSQLVVDDVLAAGFSLPRGIVGGKRWTGAASIRSGITNTEVVTNMETGSVALTAGRLYLIAVKMKTFNTVANDDWIFRLRETNVSGTQRGEFVWRNQSASYGWSHPLIVSQYVPATNETKNFVWTAARLTGTGSLNVEGGGTVNSPFMIVVDMGAANMITTVT